MSPLLSTWRICQPPLVVLCLCKRGLEYFLLPMFESCKYSRRNPNYPCYRMICLTIGILHRGPFSISLCRLINPFLINPEPKIYIFPHICSLTALQDVLLLMLHYISHILGFVPENTKWGRVSMSRQKIFDIWPSIYWKRSDLALQLHSGGYKSTISSYGKRERKHSTLRAKLL